MTRPTPPAGTHTPRDPSVAPAHSPDHHSPANQDPPALEALRRIRARSPSADPLAALPDVHPARLPRHIAIIMDGNGRWAAQRGLPRVIGHRNGAAAVRSVITEAASLGLECLTLFSFSSENWKRPDDEVQALMALCVAYCQGERDHLIRENIRVRVIGRRDGLPGDVVAAIAALEAATATCTGLTLCLAINYGSRAEIVEAARALARDAAQGRLDPDHITEHLFERRLDTAGLPDPDLLIRTGGELRVSNYLLWQISYAEIYVSDLLWPDFDVPALHRAIRDFAARNRRFGGLDTSPALTSPPPTTPAPSTQSSGPAAGHAPPPPGPTHS